MSGPGNSTISFPPGAPVCGPGDHLVCPLPSGRWGVYRVEDLLLVERLVPLLPDPSALMREANLLDSMAPAYDGEVHLLLTVADGEFPDASAAEAAVRQGGLADRMAGVLRSARDVSDPACRVIRGADPAG